MIFAFLGLPARPSRPSTAIQPLLLMATAQKEPWPHGIHPTYFSAAWAQATHLQYVGHSRLPASCTGQHACTSAGQNKPDVSLYLCPDAYGTIQT